VIIMTRSALTTTRPRGIRVARTPQEWARRDGPHLERIKKGRKYPINTRKRAQVALGLVGMHGTAAQKRQVRAAVKRRYGIGKKATRRR
jgi:hypothetical protein